PHRHLPPFPTRRSSDLSEEDGLRFQLEKELLERVQGHPNIITLYASGESDNVDFLPVAVRDKVENDFMILELCDMSLEERLKGSDRKSTRLNSSHVAIS